VLLELLVEQLVLASEECNLLFKGGFFGRSDSPPLCLPFLEFPFLAFAGDMIFGIVLAD